MPHCYNTRARNKGDSLVAETVCRSILYELIKNCVPSEMADTDEQSRSNSRTADQTEPEVVQGEQSTSTRKEKGKKGNKFSNATVMHALNKLSSRLDDMDKRMEQQELASALSIRTAPSAHSSPKPARKKSLSASRAPPLLPSPEELRTDSRTQREVERRMRAMQSVSRSDETGMFEGKVLKSGRYRLGDQRVKCAVRWPHESVSLGEDFKMPSYEELSSYQWTQGFAMNIYHEKDAKVKDVMLLHLASLMQDAEELNWLTAKRAHAGVLMDMERGQLHWDDRVAVERTRQRFTQRALKSETMGALEETETRICKKFNQGRCHLKGDVTEHKEGRILFKHVCWRCYRATKKYVPHPETQCTRAKRVTPLTGEKMQV